MTEKRSDLSYCIAKLSSAKRSQAKLSLAKHSTAQTRWGAIPHRHYHTAKQSLAERS